MQKYFKWISLRWKSRLMSVVKYASQRAPSIKIPKLKSPVHVAGLLNGNNYKYTLFFQWAIAGALGLHGLTYIHYRYIPPSCKTTICICWDTKRCFSWRMLLIIACWLTPNCRVLLPLRFTISRPLFFPCPAHVAEYLSLDAQKIARHNPPLGYQSAMP